MIIAGGRDYWLTPEDFEWLDRYHQRYRITRVLCGMQRGADCGGWWWAHCRSVEAKPFYAEWRSRGRAAGPIRNQRMADEADKLIAFPGGIGTRDMVLRAKSKGLGITIMHPSMWESIP